MCTTQTFHYNGVKCDSFMSMYDTSNHPVSDVVVINLFLYVTIVVVVVVINLFLYVIIVIVVVVINLFLYVIIVVVFVIVVVIVVLSLSSL